MADDFGYDSFQDAEYNDDEYTGVVVDRSNEPQGYHFRPSLGDDHKAGFFSLDRATQMEESEIIDLKHMTEVVQELLLEASSMKRDITFARHVINADFESKLMKKSIELYTRSNERIVEIEKIHEKRTDMVRKAFTQQLRDAIASMRAHYIKEIERRLRENRDESIWVEKVNVMTSTIQRNESIIVMLKTQLEQCQRRADAQTLAHELNRSRLVKGHMSEEKASEVSRSESIVAEIDGLRDDIHFLEQKCARLDDTVQEREKTNQNMLLKMDSLKEQLGMERALVNKLQEDNENFQRDSRKAVEDEAQSFEGREMLLRREMEEKIREARAQAIAEAMGEAARLQTEADLKYAQLRKDKMAVEKKLAETLNVNQQLQKDAGLISSAKRVERELTAEVARLKAEIDKIHKAWDKKFKILQQSLHALKDESYLRQTLQRQAAQLHQACISYGMEMTNGHMASATFLPSPSKNPLPNIGCKGGKSPDAMSYTVSATSERNTDVFTPCDDLGQVDQDLPEGFPALPCPPSRTPTSVK